MKKIRWRGSGFRAGSQSPVAKYWWVGALIIVVVLGWMSIPVLTSDPRDKEVVIARQRRLQKDVSLNALGMNPEGAAPGSPLIANQIFADPEQMLSDTPSSLYQGKGGSGIHFEGDDADSAGGAGEAATAGRASASSSAPATARGKRAGGRASGGGGKTSLAKAGKLEAMKGLGGTSAGSAGAFAPIKTGNTNFGGTGTSVSAKFKDKDDGLDNLPPETGASRSLQNLQKTAEDLMKNTAGAAEMAAGAGRRSFDNQQDREAGSGGEKDQALAAAGIEMDEAVKSLKNADEDLNVREPPELEEEDMMSEADMNQQIMQAFLQGFVGAISKGIGQYVSAQLNGGTAPAPATTPTTTEN